MLLDLRSSFYNYLRGAIFILTLYQLLFYFQTKKLKFLYYSLYFLTLSLFFIRHELPTKFLRNLLGYCSPSLLTLGFYFYLSFAREVLNTKKIIPKWDIIIVKARYFTLGFILLYLLTLIYYGFNLKGFNAEVKIFNIFSILFSIFCMITFYKFHALKSKEVNIFIFGSFCYFILANVTFLTEIFYGLDKFHTNFKIHLIFFTYIGVIIEAIIFALLLGLKTNQLEQEKQETIKKIDQLKKIVIKNHIILKDKTKVYIADLTYIKSDDHYLKVFLSNSKSHFVRGKLNKIVEELPPNFIRCHRSYVVNRNFIKQINNTNIVLVDKTELPLSRSYKNKF